MFKGKNHFFMNSTKSSRNNLWVSSCFLQKLLLPKQIQTTFGATFVHFLVGYITLQLSSSFDYEPKMSSTIARSSTYVVKSFRCLASIFLFQMNVVCNDPLLFCFFLNQSKRYNMWKANTTFQFLHLVTIRKIPIVHNNQCPWNILATITSPKLGLIV